MAAPPCAWYQRMFGKELETTRATQNVNAESQKVPICKIFENVSKDFVLGVYFSSVEAVGDERCSQIVQLVHSVNTKGDKSPNSNSVPELDKCGKFLEIVHVLLGPRKCKDLSDKIQNLPWYFVPVSESHILERLTRRFEIKTISPTLVLLNGKTGDLITKHGLEKLLTDPTGLEFPWTPKPLSRILEKIELLTGGDREKKNEAVLYEHLNGIIVGFYFSAHWCPPCRCFTPQLKQTYGQLKNNQVAMEIIFVSSDRSLESFDVYLATMPWLAVPYHCEEARLELAALFGVQGIPTLVITDANGKVITTEGRIEVNVDPNGLKFPWEPKLVNVLTERNASRLQDAAAVVLFVEGEDSEIEFAESILLPVAKSIQDGSEQPDRSLEFFIAADSAPADTLIDLMGLDEIVPLLTIVNLPEGNWSILEEGVTINQEAVQEMTTKFFNHTLPRINISRSLFKL